MHFQYSVIILLTKGGRGAPNPSVWLQTCSHNSEWMKLRRLRSTDWDSAPVTRLSFLFSPCEAGGRECSVYRQPGRGGGGGGWWQSHTTCRRFLRIGWSERFHNIWALLPSQPKEDTDSMLSGDLRTLQEWKWKQLLGNICP